MTDSVFGVVSAVPNFNRGVVPVLGTVLVESENSLRPLRGC